MPVKTNPTTEVSASQEAIAALIPTGTVVFAESGSRRTKPASTSPMRVMKSQDIAKK